MTELEKMLKGMIYDAGADKDLVRQREICKDLCYEFNLIKPSDRKAQKELLDRLLKKTGRHCSITAPFWCDYGWNIEMGENFYANHNLVILDGAKVTFGNNVFIAPNCGFYTAGHPFNIEERNQGLEYARPITVGDNVWIGAGVSVLPGVRIGSNTVIGAGSVVNKDIPDRVLAAGNPCRVIRRLSDEELGFTGK